MRKQQKKAGAFNALGIVFGDIGTSPLYALPAALLLIPGAHTVEYIYGLTSMIIWAVTLIVGVKYVMLVARADNNGEGGIMALLALLKRNAASKRVYLLLVMLGLLGMALFYGDSVITPAISVLSAIEGLHVAWPSLAPYIVALSFVILTGLFLVQSRGTARIAKIFSPVMMVWFVTIGIVGLLAVLSRPEALVTLLPTTAFSFMMTHPIASFTLLGAVILSITGAEALYADMGHFGISAVRRSWFAVVFPALVLNYMGQAVFVVGHPGAMTTPFYGLFPDWLQLPAVILATCATLIASQAVISGAFSLTRQAVRLGFAPRMHVTYTSDEKGQVYMTVINWLLYVLVGALVLGFGSSEKLAGAFGMAVSGTLLIDTVLFASVMALVWRTKWYKIALVTVCFGLVELCFVASSLSKFIHGAWIPLAIAAAVFTTMVVWTLGHVRLAKHRHRLEESTKQFVSDAYFRKIRRTPGVAVYLASHSETVPPALRKTMEQFEELPRTVLLVTVHTESVPHVEAAQRVIVDSLEHADDGIVRVILRFGFNDIPNIPLALLHNEAKIPELTSPLENASYFVSNSKPVPAGKKFGRLFKYLFVFEERNARNPSDYFHLPPERTIDMVSLVEI